jgi:hypothetical protein
MLPPSAAKLSPLAEGHTPLSWLQRLINLAMGRAATLVLAVLSLLLGMATFSLLAGDMPLGSRPNFVLALMFANLAALALLGVVLAGRLTRMWRFGRRTAARASGAALQRGCGGAGHCRGRIRDGVFSNRYPGLVQ